MIDPSFELMAAVIARLKADTAVSAYCAGRIYDRPPDVSSTGEGPTSPYMTVSGTDDATDEAECIDGTEITLQIDCYSWGAGEAFSSAEVRKLAYAVRRSLHDAEFTLSENALADCRHRITRYQREGVINRAIITITAVVEIND